MTKITVIAEHGGCEHRKAELVSIISQKARSANDTLFSRAFHTTPRYDFRANDIRALKLNLVISSFVLITGYNYNTTCPGYLQT